MAWTHFLGSCVDAEGTCGFTPETSGRCSSAETCYAGTCIPSCRTNTDCPQFIQYCDFDGAVFARFDTGSGASCLDATGMCDGYSVSQTTPCPNGCMHGFCIP